MICVIQLTEKLNNQINQQTQENQNFLDRCNYTRSELNNLRVKHSRDININIIMYTELYLISIIMTKMMLLFLTTEQKTSMNQAQLFSHLLLSLTLLLCRLSTPLPSLLCHCWLGNEKAGCDL